MFNKLRERLSFDMSFRNDSSSDQFSHCAPNTKLAYDPSLVATLVNISLYVYLRHSASMPSSVNAVKLIKSEMDKISRNVMRSLDREIDNDITLGDDFIVRFEKIGVALTERINKEEAFVYPKT